MDIGSWGQKIVQTMTGVLDGEKVLVTPSEETVHPSFSVRSDIENAFQQNVFQNFTDENWKVLFSKLSAYFEAGFLLTYDNGKWATQDTFIFGKKFAPPKQQLSHIGFNLPLIRRGQIARGRGVAVLKAYHLTSLTDLKESSAFLVRVSHKLHFILICNRPGPWQQTFIEKFFDLLMQIPTENS